MKLSKKIFKKMVKGYQSKNINNLFNEQQQEQRTEIETSEGKIPIIIKPVIKPVTIPLNINNTLPQQLQNTQTSRPIISGNTGISNQSLPQQNFNIINNQSKPIEEEDEIFEDMSGMGYEIPKINSESHMPEFSPDSAKMKPIIYPLIPERPKKDEKIFSYVKIYWNDKQNRYIYSVIEPKMTENIKKTLGKIKELLEEKLDVDFSKLKVSEASNYLRVEIEKLINYYKFNINENEKNILQYFIERDFMGLGKIEPLMHDNQIEDISCDGLGIPIFIFHRNPKIGSIMTNVKFDTDEELDSFITKLAQLSGKSISVARPLLDGILRDGSRLQATLATDIARKGSNFTIRKFTKESMTPIHLIEYGTLDIKSMAYIWMAIDYGRSILVSGGTASGKTSFLNAISIFIRPDKKIISIEDTGELRLPHPHWVPTVARTTTSDINVEGGQVDMFALLKESLRQRPDYIIVGEVRGKEAAVLFQQMATGHPSYATIHADNIEKLVNRLTTAPISLPKSLVGSLDLIVFLTRVKYRNKFVRRSTAIVEMITFQPNKSRPNVNTVFKWNSEKDYIETVKKSILLKKITRLTGMGKKEILEELKRRITILKWLHQRGIKDYDQVYKIINMYYNFPNKILSIIYGDT